MKEFLLQPALAPTVVAANAGFSDRTHPTRVFRRWTDATPARVAARNGALTVDLNPS